PPPPCPIYRFAIQLRTAFPRCPARPRTGLYDRAGRRPPRAPSSLPESKKLPGAIELHRQLACEDLLTERALVEPNTRPMTGFHATGNRLAACIPFGIPSRSSPG